MKLPPGDWWQGAATQRVMTALEGKARFVGGAVRDALLGKEIQDVDLATLLLPDQVLDKAHALGLKAIPTGIHHGAITLMCGDRSFDVTTLRRDAATDGRHAAVAFTTCWKADAARRDFTLNALYADATGRVYDPMGGLADLTAGRVVFLGEARCRIAEDYLRILRYFRFFARYARLPPDPELLALLTETAPGLDRLSPERIWSELKLLLAGPKPEAGFELMQATGILARLFPEARLDGTRILATLPEGADWAARLLALFPEGADLPRLAARLRWSKAETRFLAQRQQAAETTLATPYPLLRRFGSAPLYSGLDLRQARGQTDREAWRDWISVPLPPFPIRAADIQALGIAPGPAVGKLLRAVEIWWETGHCQAGRTEMLAYLQSLIAHTPSASSLEMKFRGPNLTQKKE